MSKIDSIFEDVYSKSKAQKYAVSRGHIATNVAKSAGQYSVENRGDLIAEDAGLPVGPQVEYQIQNLLRPFFGKEGLNEHPIGTHPDFISLEGSDTGVVNHYVCTLFVDIKGSTRLSLLYDLEEVFDFKNAVIKTCVEAIRALDGYVHRIMGDAVMAFFGGANKSKEDAVADAVNCCLSLRTLLELSIRPWMRSQRFDDEDFGFRIGLDFGDTQEVLWGHFGYHTVGEVSATGLPVDMASKLQGLANKNQTMLGQGILDFVNWPSEYSKVKVDSNGNKIPFVIPNLTKRDATSLNYRMSLLDYEKCLRYLALPAEVRGQILTDVVANEHVSYECFVKEDDQFEKYISGSRYLDKGLDLKFDVKVSTRSGLCFPLKVTFIKTNHGVGVPANERDTPSKPIVKIITSETGRFFNITPEFSDASFPESTAYRGIHSMKCEIQDAQYKTVFRDWIAVKIK